MVTVAILSVVLAWLPLLMAWKNLTLFVGDAKALPTGTHVSILIPARNEEAAIEASIRRALASAGVEVEVRVLDDDSTDRTATIVSRLADEDRRVTLHRAPPLPPGWAGKQRACSLLAAEARFDVLMFVDVDVELAPDAAAIAAGFLLGDSRLGMVSGFPQEIALSVAEQLVVPWIHVLLLGYLPMDRMRRYAAPAYGAACGQWIVARRDAYRAVGGHAAAPLSRHDGTSLPRLFRTGGWMTDVFDGKRLARCRMYRDVATVVDGFAKSPGEGLATWGALPVWTVLIGVGHVMPAVLLIVGCVQQQWLMIVAGVLGSVANVVLRALLCVRCGQPWLGALLHPVGAAAMIAIQWYSLLRNALGGQSEWRGRRYLSVGAGARAE